MNEMEINYDGIIEWGFYGVLLSILAAWLALGVRFSI